MLCILLLQLEVAFVQSKFLELFVHGLLVGRGHYRIVQAADHEHCPFAGLQVLQRVDDLLLVELLEAVERGSNRAVCDESLIPERPVEWSAVGAASPFPSV